MINDLKEARNFFKNDRFATEATGIIVLNAEKGFSRCMINVTPVHMNNDGFVQGGAIFTLADTAFAVAANMKSAHTVTLDSHINYLLPSRAKQLYAECECVRDGRTVCLYVVNVTDSDANKIAYATFTGYRVRND